MNSQLFSVDYGELELAEIYFDDLDVFHTLYHGRYLAVLDRALHRYWIRMGYRYDAELSAPDTLQLVRDVSITYDRPIRDYGLIVIHFWTEQIGTTSLTLGFRFLASDGTEEYAHGRRVTVKVDPASRKPAPWTERARADAEALRRPVGVR